MFANFKLRSQQPSTTTTPSTAVSITSSTIIASQLPHAIHNGQSKITQPSYHCNQQYSIIGLTNAAGTLVERYSYTAYGTLGIYAANGTVRTTSTYANRYTYTGREYDPDLNLYHFRARWYDPATGGFISRDPLGYVDGMSLNRGYFGVDGVDPNGFAACKCEERSVSYSHKEGYSSIAVLKREVKFSKTTCKDLGWDKRTENAAGILCGTYYHCEPLSGKGVGKDHERLEHDLAVKLIATCLPTCPDCERNAISIARMISWKVRDNGNWNYLGLSRLPWGFDYDNIRFHSNERYNGYWCWDWADLFLEAFNLVETDCFTAKTHASAHVDGRMHWFLAITGPNGSVVYVDDNFWFRGEFVHDEMPCGGDYKHMGESTLSSCGLTRHPGMK